MQDPIRQPAGWNHHHRPPQISLSLCIFIPLHFQLLNIKNRFLHYMCVLEMGLMAAAEKGVCVCVCVVGWGGWCLLMGEWRAWKWRAGWLNACPSLPILLVTGGLSFSPTGAYLPAFIWQPGLANLHVRQTTNGPVHVKIGGGAWQFLHNAVSFWLDPRPRAMSPFIIRERGRWGKEITRPFFLSPPAAASLLSPLTLSDSLPV